MKPALDKALPPLKKKQKGCPPAGRPRAPRRRRDRVRGRGPKRAEDVRSTAAAATTAAAASRGAGHPLRPLLLLPRAVHVAHHVPLSVVGRVTAAAAIGAPPPSPLGAPPRAGQHTPTAGQPPPPPPPRAAHPRRCRQRACTSRTGAAVAARRRPRRSRPRRAAMAAASTAASR